MGGNTAGGPRCGLRTWPKTGTPTPAELSPGPRSNPPHLNTGGVDYKINMRRGQVRNWMRIVCLNDVGMMGRATAE